LLNILNLEKQMENVICRDFNKSLRLKTKSTTMPEI
jgi:hypothetical protein